MSEIVKPLTPMQRVKARWPKAYAVNYAAKAGGC